jgi:hypothetical protein
MSPHTVIFSQVRNTGNTAVIASFNQQKCYTWTEQEANCIEIFVGVILSELPVKSAHHFLHSEREGRNVAITKPKANI